MVSNCDSAFTVWNTLTPSELKTPNIVEDESSGEFEQQCYMVQGNDSLEVYSESQLDVMMLVLQVMTMLIPMP